MLEIIILLYFYRLYLQIFLLLYCRKDQGRSKRSTLAIFSHFVKLAVDRYNLRLRFGIYKFKLLRSIVGSRSVVSELFDQFYEGCIIRYPGFVQPAPGHEIKINSPFAAGKTMLTFPTLFSASHEQTPMPCSL